MTRQKRHLIIYASIILFTIFPFIAVLISGFISSICGCKMVDGPFPPCYVFGVDISGPLSAVAFMGWLVILTVPVGVATLILYSIVVAIEESVHARRARQSKS